MTSDKWLVGSSEESVNLWCLHTCSCCRIIKEMPTLDWLSPLFYISEKNCHFFLSRNDYTCLIIAQVKKKCWILIVSIIDILLVVSAFWLWYFIYIFMILKILCNTCVCYQNNNAYERTTASKNLFFRSILWQNPRCYQKCFIAWAKYLICVGSHQQTNMYSKAH